MNWQQYIYQYSVGGIIFFIGLLVPIFTEGFKIKTGRDIKLLIILLIGLLYYALGHGLWIYFAGK